MTRADYAEMVALLRSLLVVLGRAAKGNTGIGGANLTYAIRVVIDNASTGVAVSDLRLCFALATAAGGTLPSMMAVFAAATSTSPRGGAAKTIVAYFAAEAVIQAAAILNATTFTSRDDVDAALVQIGAAFDVVESAAGNALQTDLYRALITLHAATTANLTTQAYPLPRLVTFTMGKTMSALTLAQRLYGDATRAAELAAENQTFNPAFMQMTGRALSA